MANFLLPGRVGDLTRCVFVGQDRSLANSSRALATLAVEKVWMASLFLEQFCSRYGHCIRRIGLWRCYRLLLCFLEAYLCCSWGFDIKDSD